MSFRTTPRRLGRPTVTATPTASLAGSSAARAPLLQFPAFHPAPFQHDKFLSIKTRSLETYTKVRGDVLRRCAELRSQLQRSQERAKRAGDGATASPSSVMSAASLELPTAPLTPHQAEELLLLSKKVESLADFQGMVLSDELVWRMFHLCVQCGAPQQALNSWLLKHILAEKRGPPYPLFIVQDLTTLLRASVLSRLADSGAGLSCISSSLLAGGEGDHGDGRVALEDGLVAAQRYLRLCSVRGEGEATAEVDEDSSQTAQLYDAHLLQDYVWPVWRSLEAMQLTLDTLKSKQDTAFGDDGDEDHSGKDEHGGAPERDDHKAGGVARDLKRTAASRWLPDTAAQTAAVRATLMSVTPLYSFHERASSASAVASASPSAGGKAGKKSEALTAHGPPSFSSEVEAIAAPLRALLDVWMTVAQCASEAKDTRLLREVQRTVCVGVFKTASSVGSAGSSEAETQTYTLNEAAWCQYTSSPSAPSSDLSRAAESTARAVFHSFVSGVLSVVQYGLLCAEQERGLWQLHDTSALLLGGAAMLRSLRSDQNGSSKSNSLPRRLQALAVADQRNAEDAQHDLLCNVLPRALRTTARVERNSADDAAMMEAVHIFLSQTLAVLTSTGATTTRPKVPGADTTLRYADAGLYVGLAMGDEALLQRAAIAASMPEGDTEMVRLTAHALNNYRRTVAFLAQDAEGEAVPTPSSAAAGESDDVWPRMQALLAQSRGASNAVVSPQLLEGSLQVVLLDTARRQAACAAAYVHALDSPSSQGTGAASATAAAQDGEESHAGVGEAHEDDAFSLSADVDESRRTAAEQAWSDVEERSVQNIVEGVERVALLLNGSADLASSTEREAPCLSPSALSSIAVLARVGTYVEREAGSSATAASSFTASLDTIISRLAADSCTLLQQALSSTCSPASLTPDVGAADVTTAVAGTWAQWVLLALMARRDWTRVLAVLKALDGHASEQRRASKHNAAGAGVGAATPSLLCSATVDPAVFAAIFACAQEDGAASVCAFLRPRRESLFF